MISEGHFNSPAMQKPHSSLAPPPGALLFLSAGLVRRELLEDLMDEDDEDEPLTAVTGPVAELAIALPIATWMTRRFGRVFLGILKKNEKDTQWLFLYTLYLRNHACIQIQCVLVHAYRLSLLTSSTFLESEICSL